MDFAEALAAVEGRTLLDEHRLRNLWELAERAEQAGEEMAAEVGVSGGGVTKMLALAMPSKKVLAFDTFQGLPANEDGLEAGRFAAPANTLEWLTEQPNVQVRRGLFPYTLTPELAERTFCLVHLDADLHETTAEAIRFFWPRLRGWLVIDDYKRADCPGVEQAVREAGIRRGNLWADHRWLNQLILHR